MPSHAVRQAPVEPGRQHTNVPLARPARARLCTDLAVINLPDASVLAPLGLVMRKTEPRSAIAEKCFAQARKLFAAKNLSRVSKVLACTAVRFAHQTCGH
jgi:hypothetical protein